MKFVFYTHSLVSDWNHGNAHFLRGLMRELIARGHTAIALEPADGWSRANLERSEGGASAQCRFEAAFPNLVSYSYGEDFWHEEVLDDADVVVVHEWTDPPLVRRIARARREGGDFTLIFHDTHHRMVSAEPRMAEQMLGDYDLVLAFGEALRQRYLLSGWGGQVFTWHEAADTRLFQPIENEEKQADLIWIGNWGDGERTRELHEFLIEPAGRLGLSGRVHGVRYPPEALQSLERAGLFYRGWIANFEAPRAFSQHRVTVHVPRRPYVKMLPGIPTIRVFEVLAAGIPLISAPWDDVEGLFRPGEDFLFAGDGLEMEKQLKRVLADPALAAALQTSGLETIRNRHSCSHRVEELFAILARNGTTRVKGELTPKEAAE